MTNLCCVKVVLAMPYHLVQTGAFKSRMYLLGLRAKSKTMKFFHETTRFLFGNFAWVRGCSDIPLRLGHKPSSKPLMNGVFWSSIKIH